MTATDGIGRIDVLAIVNALFARLTPIRAINVLLEPGSTFSTGRTTFVDSGLVGGSVFSIGCALVTVGEAFCPPLLDVGAVRQGASSSRFLDPAADDPELLNLSMARLRVERR